MKPTPNTISQYHVFLASPGDVQVERQAVRKFFDDYNRSTAHIWNARFDVVDWENYSTTGVGRPQELITQQTLDKYRNSLALVIGIMAQRFGSPSGKEESGTVEEFNWAMDSHQASGFPEIKWFFRKVDKLEMPSDPTQLIEAVTQWQKVLAFRKKMQDLHNPVFYAEYPSPAGFAEILARDLSHWLADPARPWAAQRADLLARSGAATAPALVAGFDSEGYKNAVLKRYDKLNFEMLDTTGASYNAVRLWSVFVAQSVRECHQYNPRLLEIPKEHQRRLLGTGEISEKELLEAEKQAHQQRQEYFQQPLRSVLEIVDDALRSTTAGAVRKLVILGDPGSGKSSLIRYLAVRWAGISDPAVRDTQPVPIVVDLGAYGRWRCDQRKDFIRFLEEAPVWHSWPAGLLAKLLAQPGRIVLLLDGLDEVFDVKPRAEVVDDIQRFSSQFPHLPILVTSRVVGYQAHRLRDAEFRHFMLQDLDAVQITDFLQRWHEVTFDDPAQATPKRDRLQKAVRDSKSIAMLAGNPLLLTMMAILNRNQELPRDRADLYAQASRVLLHQWDTERALENFPGISNEIGLREKTDLLRRIAAHMQAAPGGLKGNLIDGPTLTSLIESYLQDELHIAQSRAVARAVAQQLRLRNFILCFVGADSYAFVHRTFLEYFCAADFVHQFNVAKTLEIDGLIDLFEKHCCDDEWREVLRLICGQIDGTFGGQIIKRLVTLTNLKEWNGSTPIPELPLAIWCFSEVRNTHAVRDAAESLTTALFRTISRCKGPKNPSEDSNGFGHGSLYSFLTSELLPAIQAVSGNWPSSALLNKKAITQVKHLNSDSLQVWAQFVAAITKNRLLVLQLGDCPYFLLRRGVVLSLVGNWPDQDTRRHLTSIAVKDSNGYPRCEALSALAKHWPDDVTQQLLLDRCSNDRTPWVRREALLELAANFPNAKTIRTLRLRITEEADSDPRIHAIEALANRWPDPTTRDLFALRAVKDKDAATRSAALQVLANKWPDQITRSLLALRAVKDKDAATRKAALQALAERWSDKATRDLLAQRAIEAHDLSERGTACSELGKMHSEFGHILPTPRLCGAAPYLHNDEYLDPLEPIPRDQILKAAAEAGIPTKDIDAQVDSLSAHLGWDITLGAKMGK